MEDAIKAKIKRGAGGKLLPGHGLVSPGRPKGQSLKEFWRQRFAMMSDAEKLDFSKKIGLETIWKMGEGNPHSTGESDVTSGGQPLQPLLVKFLDDKDNAHS